MMQLHKVVVNQETIMVVKHNKMKKLNSYWNDLYENFIQTYTLSIKKPLNFLLTMVLDFLFVFIFFMLSNNFLNRIEIHLQNFLSAIDLNNFSLISASLNRVFILVLIYIFIALILFILIQSVNWFIANKIVQNKIKFFSFAKNFSLVSFISFGLLSLWLYITLKVSINLKFIDNLFVDYISRLLIFITLFFMFIGLSFSYEKNIYKKIFTKAHYFILPYIIISCLFLFVDLFSELIFYFGIKNIWFLIITGLLIFKVIAFSRIYFIKTAKEIK
jgi:hypothetical protein